MSRLRAWFVIGLFLASVSSADGQPARSPDATLTPGAAIERRITAGELHAFQLVVQAQQLVRLDVEQVGADVRLEMHAEGLPPMAADDEASRRYGRELLTWITPAALTVRVVVHGKSVLPAGGGYVLAVRQEPVHEPWPNALKALDEAAAQAEGRDRTSPERALEAFARACDALRQTGDPDRLAACLGSTGRHLLRRMNRPDDALGPLQEAYAIVEQHRRPTALVLISGQIGYAQRQLGRPDDALATYDRASRERAGVDPVLQAIVEDDIAVAASELGDFERAVEFGRRAAQTFEAAGASRDQFIALERLALTYSRTRRLDAALAAINEAIALAGTHGRDDDLATVIATSGRIQLTSGDEDAALTAFRRSVGLFKAESQAYFVAWLSIGRLHNRRGDWALARDALQKALDRTPAQLRDLWAALATELGVALLASGDATGALALQSKALDIVRAGGSRVGEFTVWRDIAATYRAVGDLAAARTAVDRAATLADAMPGKPHAPLVLRERARNARAAGDLATASQQLEIALDLLESHRGRLQSRALRASFGANAASYYGEAIDVAMQMHLRRPEEGHAARAFELFERSRARSLTELLAESETGVIADVDPEMMAEWRGLLRQVSAMDLVIRETGARPGAAARIVRLERELDDRLRQLTVLETRMRSTSARYPEFVRPTPATLTEARRLLDADTVLLAFAVHENTSWAWALTRASLQAIPLPPAARVDALARRLHAQLGTAPRAKRATLERGSLAADLAELSQVVLAPLAESLGPAWPAARRLAIVTTGALEYIPFAALPDPLAGPAVPLVSTHEIVQVPSISTLALLRRGEHPPIFSRGTRIAILADAVYTSDDPRVRSSRTPPRTGSAPPVGVTASSGGDILLQGTVRRATRRGFGRLVFSREEARAIASLAKDAAVHQALDFAANIDALRAPPVRDAHVVHIASHGILNSARPELSGLVLSLVDARGRPREGVLRLPDIFNFQLAADLVVLSGCETGLGKQIQGEGLVGLTRAFMYAGASRVIASLWPVDDLATAELMRRFYTALLQRRLPPAAALRAAQHEMSSNPRWSAPYYWAGFVVQGDWR